MEKLIFGLQVTVLGIGVVFTILAMLNFVIEFQSKLLAPKPKKEEPKQQVTVVEQVPVAASVVEEDEEELIAVISAAIAACGHKVVVKNITRVYGNTGTPWGATGRQEAMNLRQIG